MHSTDCSNSDLSNYKQCMPYQTIVLFKSLNIYSQCIVSNQIAVGNRGAPAPTEKSGKNAHTQKNLRSTPTLKTSSE